MANLAWGRMPAENRNVDPDLRGLNERRTAYVCGGGARVFTLWPA